MNACIVLSALLHLFISDHLGVLYYTDEGSAFLEE